MKFQHLLYSLAAWFLLYGCQTSQNSTLEDKIDSLLSQMTLEEKVNMIHASSSFTSGGVERLGIPELVMSDGPHGVRHEHGRDWEKDNDVLDSSTYLPVGTSLAATWNAELGYKFGQVLGAEARARGKDVILGPGLNIIRDPLNGRNFEYLTEDPYLNGVFVEGYVKGVQEHDVAVSAKHYIANSLEYERRKVDVRMSDRALREIYLPGFQVAVDAGALTVMAAYNRFRGDWCAQSEYLLIDILKKEMGFEGLVMSDWNAVNNTLEAVNGGLDIEMGTDLTMFGYPDGPDYGKFWMGDTVVTLVRNGTVAESVIDDKVRRILRVMFRLNMFGERKQGAYNTPEHQAIARQIANEAVILLKNEDVLPLDKSVSSVAVVGANATWKHSGAGGSSQVKAFYEITPLQGIQELLENSVDIRHAQGYTISRDGGATDDMIREAVELVSQSDAAIYIGGWIKGYSDDWNDNAFDAEAQDKMSMSLPFDQDRLIRAVLDANPNTIIVLMGGGPIDMQGWMDAKGIIQAGYPGMEGGNAIAAVLFGDVNPSGKLPMTFPARLEDSPARALSSYPDSNLVIDHKEDIYVGYRYFDTYEVEPAFAFGHGLSYTSFDYSDLSVVSSGTGVTVSFTVTNSGNRVGAEVAQVYVRDVESSIVRPVKELKAFEKVMIESGASAQVRMDLDKGAFSFYDEENGAWTMESGVFEILVGSSSRDIRLQQEIEL